MIGMTVIQKMGGFPDLWGSVVDSGGIANFQTLFNLVTAVVLLPFTGVLVNIACRVVKDDVVQTDIYPEMAALDKKLMTVPTVALNEVANSVVIVAKVAKENIERSLLQLVEYTDKRSEEILASEDRLDQFTDSVDNYLIELSGNIETESDNRQRNMLMQCVHDIERIGDYATNFDEMSKKLHDSDIHFSEEARKEMDILGNAVEEILRLTVEA